MFEKRIIAIDYGRKRIGVAVSDPLRIIAQPLKTIIVKSKKDGVEQVCQLLNEYEVELVLIGLPVSLKGGEGQMCHEVKKFADQIKKSDYKIEYIDESFSSAEAKKIMRSAGKTEKEMRGKLDILAAQIILQEYLDRTSL